MEGSHHHHHPVAPPRFGGFLEKKRRMRGAEVWTRRYFVLEGTALRCYVDDRRVVAEISKLPLKGAPERTACVEKFVADLQDGRNGKLLATIDVSKVECAGPNPEEDPATMLNLRVLEGSIKLRAPDAPSRERWVQRIWASQMRYALEDVLADNRRAMQDNNKKKNKKKNIKKNKNTTTTTTERRRRGYDDDASRPSSPGTAGDDGDGFDEIEVEVEVEIEVVGGHHLGLSRSSSSPRRSVSTDEQVELEVVDSSDEALNIDSSQMLAMLRAQAERSNAWAKTRNIAECIGLTRAPSIGIEGADQQRPPTSTASRLPPSSSSLSSRTQNQLPPRAPFARGSSSSFTDEPDTPPPPSPAMTAPPSSSCSSSHSPTRSVPYKKKDRAVVAPIAFAPTIDSLGSVTMDSNTSRYRAAHDTGGAVSVSSGGTTPKDYPDDYFPYSPASLSASTVRQKRPGSSTNKTASSAGSARLSQRRSTDSMQFRELDDAVEWVEDLVRRRKPPDLGTVDWLQSGEVLCDLLNALRPNAVKLVNRTPCHRFKQMDNIAQFVEGCRQEFGIPESSLFEALDLLERQGLSRVLRTLNCVWLAVKVGALSPDPSPGGRKRMPRTFEEARRRTSSQMASPRPTSGASAPTTRKKGDGRALAALALKEQARSAATMLESEGVAMVVEEHVAEDYDEITVFVGDVVNVKLSQGSWSFTGDGTDGSAPALKKKAALAAAAAASNGEGENEEATTTTTAGAELSPWALVQKGELQGLVPRRCLRAGLSDAAVFKAGAGHGDRELAAKNAAKYDPIAEALAQHWIEQVTGHVFRRSFAAELRTGVLLCHLLRAIAPEAVERPYEGETPFKQLVNVTNFLQAIKKLGVAPQNCFESVDLFELKDLHAVVRCLHALSRAVQKAVPDFHGPYLTGFSSTTTNGHGSSSTAGFSEAVLQNLKVIVAVGEYRDRNYPGAAAAAPPGGDLLAASQQEHWHDAADDDEILAEAVEYRLAMLGLRDADVAGADVSGVDRTAMEPAFVVLWSSSTKHSGHMEGDERRLVHLLTAKKKRFEVVYLDVSPDRRADLERICHGEAVQLPALTIGDAYHGPFDAIQGLEDEGRLDDLLEPAPAGDGFWALPEAWAPAPSSALLPGDKQLQYRSRHW